MGEVLSTDLPNRCIPISLLLIDDDIGLCGLMKEFFIEQQMEVETANDGRSGLALALSRRFNLVLLDVMLGDDDGLKLGLEFQAQAPGTHIIIMTGGGLSDDELTICAERNFPILFKPFLAHDVLNLISGPYRRTLAAGAGSINFAGSSIRADPA